MTTIIITNAATADIIAEWGIGSPMTAYEAAEALTGMMPELAAAATHPCGNVLMDVEEKAEALARRCRGSEAEKAFRRWQWAEWESDMDWEV